MRKSSEERGRSPVSLLFSSWWSKSTGPLFKNFTPAAAPFHLAMLILLLFVYFLSVFVIMIWLDHDNVDEEIAFSLSYGKGTEWLHRCATFLQRISLAFQYYMWYPSEIKTIFSLWLQNLIPLGFRYAFTGWLHSSRLFISGDYYVYPEAPSQTTHVYPRCHSDELPALLAKTVSMHILQRTGYSTIVDQAT